MTRASRPDFDEVPSWTLSYRLNMPKSYILLQSHRQLPGKYWEQRTLHLSSMFKDSLAEDKMALHFDSDVSEFSSLVCEIIFLMCRHKKISMIQNGSSDHTCWRMVHGYCYVTGILQGLGQIGVLCKCYVIITMDRGSTSMISEICVENRCNTFRQFRLLTDYVTQVEMSFHVAISVTHKCMEWLHHTTERPIHTKRKWERKPKRSNDRQKKEIKEYTRNIKNNSLSRGVNRP